MKRITEILYLNKNRRTDPIPFISIIYCKAYDSYTWIYCIDGKVHLASRNIGEIEKELSHECFFRCHKSFIVNLLFACCLPVKTNKPDIYRVPVTNGHLIDCACRRKAAFIKNFKYIKALYIN